jgi:hypothetical protein
MSDWDFFLEPYSNSPRGLICALHLSRVSDRLQFQFRLSGGRVRELVKSAAKGRALSAGTRRDELWKSTCFEFFLSEPDQTSYFELNLALNGDWNAYVFADYRDGMRLAAGLSATPLQAVSSSDDSLELSGEIHLADFPLVGPVVLGATAVLEYQDGVKEYWALAHKGEKPDFHLRSSFVATV